MRRVSISAAWDEARVILARDGSLLITVALALVALPSVISNLLGGGNGPTRGQQPLLIDFIALVVSLIALAGQLALIRLAIGPSITVGSAITHGLRRMPVYFLAVLILVVALFIIALPCVFVLGALGVPLNARPIPLSGPVLICILLYFAIAIFFAVRLLMSSAVASAEDVGPVAILKRSWQLTVGQFWPLFGFLIIFIIGAIVLLFAVGSAIGTLVVLLMGPVQPMSAGALIIALVQALFSAAITTLFAVMIARIYLQLRDGAAHASVPSSGT